MTNHVNRFYAAVSVLAGDGHIKQRLIRAFQDHLAEIDDDELPVAIKENFADIRRRVHSVVPLKGERPIRASVRKMSGKEAGECAVLIVSMYTEMLRQTGDSHETISTPVKDAGVVPPFLVKSAS